MSPLSRILTATVVAALLLPASDLQAQITFSSQTYALKNQPCQAISGDFNEDGKPDLAVFSSIGGTVSVLLGKGDGTFSSPVDFAATTPGSLLCMIVVGDFNGDKHLDIVVYDAGDANSGTGPNANVLLGNGDGTLRSPISTSLNSFVQVDNLLGVADFNNDGKLDVALFGDEPGISLNGIVALLGNGDGTFTLGILTQAGLSPGGFVVADVNGDGKADALISEPTSFGNLFVFLGKGDGTFQSPTPLNEQAPWSNIVAAGDFNHDGKIDLVSTSFQEFECEFHVCHAVGPAGAFAVVLGNGDGTFGGPEVLAPGDFGTAAVGDFDGDGNLDIAVIAIPDLPDPPTPSFIALGDGKGGFPAQAGISFGQPSAAISFAAISIDLKGDGLSDIAFLNCCGVNNNVQVELNTTPGFSLTASAPGPPISPGASATYTINVGQQNAFSGMVSLACTSPESAGVHCSLSPSSVTPGGTSTLTVSTQGASSALLRTGSRSGWLYALWLPLGAVVIGGIGLAEKQSGRKKVAVLILGCVVGAGLMLDVACGGASGGSGTRGTPVGNYTVTVTGTSGSLQRSTTVALTVQ